MCASVLIQICNSGMLAAYYRRLIMMYTSRKVPA